MAAGQDSFDPELDNMIMFIEEDVFGNVPEFVTEEVSLDLLEDMLMLYIRAPSFSYAKDVKENHDINKGKSRATKSLRGEIKKTLF